MRLITLLLSGFILLTEYTSGLEHTGSPLWIRPNDIKRMYATFEGTLLEMESCQKILVEESPETVLEKIQVWEEMK